jgi:hypothetical protein
MEGFVVLLPDSLCELTALALRPCEGLGGVSMAPLTQDEALRKALRASSCRAWSRQAVLELVVTSLASDLRGPSG